MVKLNGQIHKLNLMLKHRQKQMAKFINYLMATPNN